MISREKAIKFLNEKVENKNIVSHMVATEALMGGVYDYLAGKGKADLGGTKEEWTMAGLLHDGDYNDKVPVEKQGIQVTDWLREAGHEIPENVAYAMAAHNYDNTGATPKSLMDWTIAIGDSLTGLIVACTLVRPDKKLASVKVKSVKKKFKDKHFAAGTRREQIAMCEEKLGIPLDKFIEISLKAMQSISDDLGL
ncbi:phosphohydrolase [Patescibacteria group bacterium]